MSTLEACEGVRFTRKEGVVREVVVKVEGRSMAPTSVWKVEGGALQA